MRIRVFSLSKRLREFESGGRRAAGTRILEMEPAVVEIPAQVILYDDLEPTILEGLAEAQPDGEIVISLPVVPPPPGTPVQVILYEDPEAPTVLEGTVTDAGIDGIYGIEFCEMGGEGE